MRVPLPLWTGAVGRSAGRRDATIASVPRIAPMRICAGMLAHMRMPRARALGRARHVQGVLHRSMLAHTRQHPYAVSVVRAFTPRAPWPAAKLPRAWSLARCILRA